jgi:hypothetical protein
MPWERVENLRRAIRKSTRSIHKINLSVERSLWHYFSKPEAGTKTVSMGLYYPEEEYFLQNHQGVEYNNKEFLLCSERLTSFQVRQNLPKLGLRPATLEEMIEYAIDDPSLILFNGLVAMGTQKEEKNIKYFPMLELALNPCLSFKPEFNCHKSQSRAQQKITNNTGFIVVAL